MSRAEPTKVSNKYFCIGMFSLIYDFEVCCLFSVGREPPGNEYVIYNLFAICMFELNIAYFYF